MPPSTTVPTLTDASSAAARLFSFPAFIRLWCARLFGTSASQMLLVAIGWQMYDLTGRAWDLGMVGLLQFLPALLLVLVAGHVVDRFHRGRIVALCMLAQAAIALLLVASAHWHLASRELLLVISVLLGIVKAFQMPAQSALTPALVPAAVLPRALAFSSMGMQGAIVAGPALGGFIYVTGAQAVYAVCAGFFITAGWLVMKVRYDHAPCTGQTTTLSTLFAGIDFIRHRPVVFGAILLDFFAVLLGGATALLPIFARDILHTGPWGLGLLRAAPAAGALLFSLLLTRRPITHRAGHVLLAAVLLYGVATVVFGLSRSFTLSAAMLMIAGAADMASIVIRQSLVQLDAPDDMRGRVGAVNSVFIGGSNQLGEFESGVTAEAFGPVGAVVLGGLGTIVISLLWLKLFPALAKRNELRPMP